MSWCADVGPQLQTEAVPAEFGGGIVNRIDKDVELVDATMTQGMVAMMGRLFGRHQLLNVYFRNVTFPANTDYMHFWPPGEAKYNILDFSKSRIPREIFSGISAVLAGRKRHGYAPCVQRIILPANFYDDLVARNDWILFKRLDVVNGPVLPEYHYEQMTPAIEGVREQQWERFMVPDSYINSI